ncbi:FepA family TonB-dependent siderophore receptor [Stenoxybacter acetivorans]|uniref:FepA family TonB-dependent siderophore receptor n=1 Tax=Stenoxybacter acetivorans TaxID=422441 RepID=UPI00056A890D|nr:FepA family TonB-dependent siderophore receptor [Stenoxybacter acetivorans]
MNNKTDNTQHFRLSLLSLVLFSGFAYADNNHDSTELSDVYVTAERQLQQSLGVSEITKSDLEKRPVVNDIAEIVRTMPGVNLTGNTASGQRGNNRQIDIRGMGPENTLILIDGRPVNSRNSVRYSWRGERDTRGDSNWIPAEDIESIEVIRGPAAARYGSGATGGVVNIVTKKVSKEFHGSLNYFTNQPIHNEEGATHRVGFNLSGPIIKDTLSFRLYGNYNKTDADLPDINKSTQKSPTNIAAGKEGVRNKDVGAHLAWQLTPEQTLILDSSYSRQGNIYTGDTQGNNGSDLTQQLANDGKETNRMYRQSYALVHDGVWEWGDTKITAQYDRTTNSRLPEGLAGATEGQINKEHFKDSLLKSGRLAAEANIPFTWGVEHVLTVGSEYTRDSLDDPASMVQGFMPGDVIEGMDTQRSGKTKAHNWAIFAEDNISLTPRTQLIPALRFDYHSTSGGNLSPGLNISQQLNDYFTVKGGIARAYKAPNLYQENPNYLLVTRGNGCPISIATGSCYLRGNSDLKPETSINKEIGVEFVKDGYLASLAYFHNDYKNKIVAGDEIEGQTSLGNNILQWSNAKKAVVSGFEGNVTIPFTDRIKWVNNFTYMIQSKNKDTGNPLSVIPKYTINSSLAWQTTDKFDTLLTFTHYGRQKPRQYEESRIDNGRLSKQELGSYGIWSVSAGYRFNKTIDARVGVNNIFDKRLYRQADNSSAQTYNEAGRAIYGNLKISF